MTTGQSLFPPGKPTPIIPNKVYGLTEAQRKARTRIATNHLGQPVGVLRVHSQGGPVGLGMLSTVHASPSMIVSSRKGCAAGTVRPASKRRSPKMGTRSLCHKAMGVNIVAEYATKMRKRGEDRHAANIMRLIRIGRGAIKSGDATSLTGVVTQLSHIHPRHIETLKQYARTFGRKVA